MQYLQLKPHVGFGIVGVRPIFLDLQRDRYLALESAAETAFRRLVARGQPIALADPQAEMLLASGLFVTGEAPRPPVPATVTIPLDEPRRRHGSAASALDFAEIGLLLLATRRALRTRPLDQVIPTGQSLAHPPVSSQHEERAEALGHRYRAVRGLVPVKPVCLPDSIVLHRWLKRHSASASLVFGVKLDPFAAHCWVQTERAVLNDSADRVAEFSPVLVVP